MSRTRIIAAALAVAGLLLGALTASAQIVETFNIKPTATRVAPTLNTGRPAEGPFYADLTQGFDQTRQTHSNWDINSDWLGVAYRRFNARYDSNGLSLSASRERSLVC